MSGVRESLPEYESNVIKLSTARSVPVIFGSGIVSQLEELFDFTGYSSVVLIADRTVAKLYVLSFTAVLKATGKPLFEFIVPAGERTKSLRVAERGCRFLLENNIDRKALICVLGGGVIGDLGGYIAATYLRGIDYIQIPTTLLAQVDSSIGGKVGVNFLGKKNMLGSFYQPGAVISDVAFLKSLPPAEMRNGLAEVVKYGLALDGELFDRLEKKGKQGFADNELVEIVSRCADLKARGVEVDETERSGERAILNFGHTVGHAIEAVSHMRKYRHGEAVAIGMMAATRISKELGMLDSGSVQRIEKVLRKLGLPTGCQSMAVDDLIEAIRFDKKTTRGETAWVLLQGIGRGVVNQPVPEKIVRKVLTEICR